MARFREHRALLEDSLATTTNVESRGDLERVLRERLSSFAFDFGPEALKVQPYCYDDRIGWDTHIVTIGGYGVAGFLDAALSDEPLPSQPSEETR